MVEAEEEEEEDENRASHSFICWCCAVLCSIKIGVKLRIKHAVHKFFFILFYFTFCGAQMRALEFALANKNSSKQHHHRCRRRYQEASKVKEAI